MVLLVTMLQGCTNSPWGRVIAYQTDPETGEVAEVLYSEYFQAKQEIADQRVLAHLIITLGDERLPEDYTIDRPVNRFLDESEAVIEIYLTNQSAEPIALRHLRLGGLELGPEEIVIEPGEHCVTKPLVRWSSVFRAARTQTLHYEFNGAAHEAEMVEERTRVDQL